ncbi:hypothetical protein ABPG75_006865 [Micractinium tetrahymenae]
MAAGPPPPPSHKLIPGCGFLVDGFRYASSPAAKTFFLTHAHSDHYTGLRDDWNWGPIFCSDVTARLVAHMLGVRHQYLCPLPLDTPTVIQGVEVTLVDANHCPGAVQFLFRLPDGRRYIHTGDMRFAPALLDNPHLQAFRGCDALFLDTTYCNPRYTFPPQEESIEYVASTVQRLLQADAQQAQQGQSEERDEGRQQEPRRQDVQQPQAAGPQDGQGGGSLSPAGMTGAAAAAASAVAAQGGGQRAGSTGAAAVAAAGGTAAAEGRPFRRLYLIATYGIGKERLLTAIHDRCGVQLHVADRKHAVMQRLDLPGYDPAKLFTTDRSATPVHVVQWGFLGETWPFFRPNFKQMEEYRQEHGADEVVGFVPTGWLYEMKRETFAVRCKGACSVHLVPYSEHSSFAELQEYVRFLRPHQVIPTVGVNGDDADKARDKMLKHFRLLVDETASKAKFLAGFHRNRLEHGAGDEPAVGKASPGGGAPQPQEQQEQPGAQPQGQPPQEASVHAPAAAAGVQEQQGPAGDVVDLLSDDEKEADEETQQQRQRMAGASGGSGQAAPAAAPPAGGDKAAAAAAAVSSPAAPSLPAHQAPAGSVDPAEEQEESDPQLDQLLAILGEGVSQQRGRQLLVAARGDLQAAINGFLDGQAGGSGGSDGGGSTPAGAAGAAARRGGAAGGSPSPAAAAGGPRGGSNTGGKRPAAAAAGKGGGKRQKGGGGAAVPAGQRSIAAFFKKPGQQQQSQSPAAAGPMLNAGAQTGQAAAPAQAAPATAPGPAGEAAAAAAAAGAEDGADELALTPGAPLAAISAPSVPAAAAAAPAGPKPKLHLPPPPSPSGGAVAPAGFFLRQRQGQGGGGGGSGREVEVSAEALALPLDKYNPVEHACWRAGEPTPYLHISRALELMDGTTKRLRKSDVLVNCFRSVLALGAPGELATAAYLISGRIAPDYEPGAELNVGGKTVVAAITEATGASHARISALYRELGDLGDVAQACKRNQAMLQRPAPLTVPGVFATLQQMSREKGQGSAARRQRLVLSLLRACRETETKFIVRTLIQALRVGANWRSVIPAIGRAVLLHREGAKLPKARLDAAAAAATAAFHVCPNLSLLIEVLLGHPLEEWQQRCSLQPGIPIKPMLAKICEGLPDAIQQLKGAPFLAEYKYDGLRGQIHMALDAEHKVRIFSRNCEEKTKEYPDVAVQTLAAAAGGATSAIVDAEIVAVERGEGGVRLRAFQELATRKRTEVEEGSIKVHVCVFAFDLLYRDGASLAHLPLAERRRQLREAFPAMQPGLFTVAEGAEFPGTTADATAAAAGPVQFAEEKEEQEPGVATAIGSGSRAADVAPAGGQQEGDGAAAAAGAAQAPAPAPALEDRLQECLLEAFAAGAEGLMLKSLAGPYEPSRRSDHWLKLKRDYCEGLHDTLDLVVIGAWWGNGRKKGWYSPYLLACYDPETEELQSVCRVMSGFSDQFYRDSLERLQKTAIPGPKPYYRTDERPSVWFDAREVWEIRGADLTISPVHKAAVGRVHEGRGIGLRFPRFLRIREDKAVEDATTAEQVAQMFHAQTRKADSAGQRLAAKQQQQLGRPAQRPRQDDGGGGQAAEQAAAAGSSEHHAGHGSESEDAASGSDTDEDGGGEHERRRRARALDLGL